MGVWGGDLSWESGKKRLGGALFLTGATRFGYIPLGRAAAEPDHKAVFKGGESGFRRCSGGPGAEKPFVGGGAWAPTTPA